MRKTLKKQKTIRGGTVTEDLDFLSHIISNQKNIAKYVGGGFLINKNVDKFFTIGGPRYFETIVATNKLNDIINKYNSRGQTLLYVACRFGTLEMIGYLLTCPNIEVNLMNNIDDITGILKTNGSTPFIGCCYERKNLSEIEKIFKMLVAYEIEKTAEKTDANFNRIANEIFNTENLNREPESPAKFLQDNAVDLIKNFILKEPIRR